MKSCCDEYCENYGCNQGRHCPARAITSRENQAPCQQCWNSGYNGQGYDCSCGAKPAKVARIGSKDHAKEPLRGSPWRLYFKDLGRSMLLCLAVMLASAIVVGVMR